MKTPRKVCKFIIPILLFYIIAAGCSGTTHSSAEFTLFKIPFGHAGKASKNEKVKPGIYYTGFKVEEWQQGSCIRNNPEPSEFRIVQATAHPK